jgi:hypothetical protein
MAAISHVYTIVRVAEMLGVDEDRLWDISEGMEPEDGHLWVYGPGDQETLAFTPDGIEFLRQLIADSTRSPPSPR